MWGCRSIRTPEYSGFYPRPFLLVVSKVRAHSWPLGKPQCRGNFADLLQGRCIARRGRVKRSLLLPAERDRPWDVVRLSVETGCCPDGAPRLPRDEFPHLAFERGHVVQSAPNMLLTKDHKPGIVDSKACSLMSTFWRRRVNLAPRCKYSIDHLTGRSKVTLRIKKPSDIANLQYPSYAMVACKARSQAVTAACCRRAESRLSLLQHPVTNFVRFLQRTPRSRARS
jgi:hypothetical protein